MSLFLNLNHRRSRFLFAPCWFMRCYVGCWSWGGQRTIIINEAHLDFVRRLWGCRGRKVNKRRRFREVHDQVDYEKKTNNVKTAPCPLRVLGTVWGKVKGIHETLVYRCEPNPSRTFAETEISPSSKVNISHYSRHGLRGESWNCAQGWSPIWTLGTSASNVIHRYHTPQSWAGVGNFRSGLWSPCLCLVWPNTWHLFRAACAHGAQNSFRSPRNEIQPLVHQHGRRCVTF